MVVVVEECLCYDLVDAVPKHQKLEQLEVVEGEEVEALECCEHLVCAVAVKVMGSVLVWECCDEVGALVETMKWIWVVLYVRIVHDFHEFPVGVIVIDDHRHLI